MDQRHYICVAGRESSWWFCSILETDCHQEGQRSPEALNVSLKSLFMLPTKKKSTTRESSCSNMRPRHTQVVRCSKELSEGQGIPQCPHCASKVTTFQTHTQETLSACLHDGRHRSLSCPSWLPQGEPGVISQFEAHPPSRQAQILQFSQLPLQQHAPSKPSPWPQLALGHHDISSQLLHPWTNMPWMRRSKTDTREQQGFKEAFGTTSHVLIALLFNHIVTTQDENVNGCVTTFQKKYSAWTKKQPFAELQIHHSIKNFKGKELKQRKWGSTLNFCVTPAQVWVSSWSWTPVEGGKAGAALAGWPEKTAPLDAALNT